jgi:hypothetical protein
MATQQNGSLATTLNKPVDPFSMVGQISRGATTEERGRAARALKEPFMREESASREGALRAEAEAKKAQVGKEVELETGYVNKLEEAQRKFESAYMAPMPERKITEFDSNAALELAGLTALMGAFAGSLSGRAGLRAMEGVTRGYKEGREDLYNRELKIYEDEVARYKDKISQAKTIYDNALKLEGARRGQGVAELKKLDPLLQDGVIAAKVKQGDLIGVGKSIDDALKLADQIEVAKIKAADSKKFRNLPSDLAKTYNTIAPNATSMRRLQGNMADDYFGIVPNENAARLLMKAVEVDLTDATTDYIKKQYKVSEDQILWWKQYDQLVAKVRNDLFGATLTKNEKENFDRTVISPATEPKIARQFFNEQVAILNRAIAKEARKGLALNVDPEVIEAYLDVSLAQLPGAQAAPAAAAQPTADNTAAIQRALQASNIPYEPDKYTYGIENGRVFREAK